MRSSVEGGNPIRGGRIAAIIKLIAAVQLEHISARNRSEGIGECDHSGGRAIS